MSSLNITLSSLLSSLASTYGADAVQTEVSSWLNSKPTSSLPTKPKKNRKNASPSDGSSTTSESKPRAPSAWNAFVEHVAGSKGSETEAFKTWLASKSKDEVSGNPKLKYASFLGKNADGSHTEAYRAFAENFKTNQAPAPAPAPAPASVLPASSQPTPTETAPSSTPTQDPAPKKRGRKPKVTAEPVPSSNSSETSEKKRGRPKGSKNKPKSEPLPLPESDSEDDEEISLTTLSIGNETFYWNETSGEIFACGEDGSMGDLLGTSTDGKTIIFKGSA